MMNQLPPTARLIGIGWYFAVCIIAGVVGGVWLDRVAGTEPLLTLLGLALGMFLALYGGYQMLMEVLQSGSDKDKKE